MDQNTLFKQLLKKEIDYLEKALHRTVLGGADRASALITEIRDNGDDTHTITFQQTYSTGEVKQIQNLLSYQKLYDDLRHQDKTNRTEG